MEENRRKVLVVDDDERLRALLERYLIGQGFFVRTAADTAAMDKALSRELFDMLVLDLMLPGEDGLAACRRLRGEKNEIGIIILTAKSEDVDRIVGLEVGADDYLTKPFNPRELVARINAVLRRHTPSPPPGAPAENVTIIHFGNCALNLASREIQREGVNHLLTTGEFALLRVLVEHPRQPMSREKLMELARGREYDAYDRAIDVQISRLRRLLEADPTKPRHLQTVWGFGYVFVPDDSAPIFSEAAP